MIRVVDRMADTIASVLRWLPLLMVLTTLAVVILRYAFETGAIALQELVMYLHGLLFLVAIPYGLKQGTHVRVDLIYSRLSFRQQRYINLIGHILFLVPVAVFVFHTSLPYVAASWRVLEGSQEVGGIPGVFLLKTLIPVFAALLTLQGITEILRTYREIREV